MKDYLSAPMIVDFNITERCNLNCIYCYASANCLAYKRELSLTEIENILVQLANCNVQAIRISGGEPLIRKDFYDIIKICKRLNMFVCLNTNGTLIDYKIIKYMQDDCIKSIGISLDSSDPNVHNSLRGDKSAFSMTMNGINKMIEAELSDKLAVVLTLTNLNAEPEALLKYFSLLHIVVVKNGWIQYAISGGMADILETSILYYDTWKTIAVWLFDKKEYLQNKYELEITVNITNESECKFELFYPFLELERHDLLSKVDGAVSENESEFISCQAGNCTIAINSLGEVYPCELMMTYEQLKAGNLREKSFVEIWNYSEILNEIRNMKVDELEGVCRHCDMRKKCGGGCRAMAYAANHTIKSCDTRCPKVCESYKMFCENILLMGYNVNIRKEFDGYYFTHPNTLKMYKLNFSGYFLLKMFCKYNDWERVKELYAKEQKIDLEKADLSIVTFKNFLKKEQFFL